MSALRLFLDSAERTALQHWLPTGLFAGVTTNPTLLRRAGVACTVPALAELAREAVALGASEVHLQAWGTTAEALLACGKRLAAIDHRVCVKLPLTAAGLQAAHALIGESVRVTFTACFDASQVVPAIALGADYVAPYLGRINDSGRDGAAEIIAMQRMVEAQQSGLRILVASLRSPAELAQLAAAGLQTFTVSPALAGALLENTQTAAAAAQFEEDATKTT